MASTQDIKRRIKSISNTKQITKAMEMVAASKMRKAQEAALRSRDYAAKALEILNDVSQKTATSTHPLLQEHSDGKICVVLVSSDKGLCGGFNTNILRAVKDWQDKLGKEKEVEFIAIGKKSMGWLKKRKS